MISLSVYRNVLARYGAAAVLHSLLIGAINRVFYFRLLVIYLMTDDETLTPCPDDLEIRKMEDPELRAYAHVVELELPAYHLDEALRNGDSCFGAFIDGKLCGYAWYATRASTSTRGVTTHFSSDVVYAYKNLTLEAFRGRGIQRWIKAHCLEHFRRQQKRGIVVAIESHNFASRRSTAGSGGRVVGFWPFVMTSSRYLGFGSPGCKLVGYRLVDARQHAREY